MRLIMPAKFDELAQYNGIPDKTRFSWFYRQRMIKLQEEFNQWSLERFYVENPGAQILSVSGSLLSLPNEVFYRK